MAGPSADFRTTPVVTPPQPPQPDAISSADAKAASAAAKPVAQGAPGVPMTQQDVTPEAYVDWAREAVRLHAAGRGATPETQRHMAAEAARRATPTTQMAEIAVGALQDARISLDLLKNSGAPQPLINDATRRVEITQAAAKIAATAGLVEQVRHNAQDRVALKTANQAVDIAETVAQLTRHPEPKKLDALIQESRWAESDLMSSGGALSWPRTCRT